MGKRKKRIVSDEAAVLDALSQTSAARLLGVARSTLAEAADAPRSADGTYPGARLVRWFLSRRLAESAAAGDPMLAVGDSPALERYRRARASLAELDYAERCGSVTSTEVLFAELLPIMQRVRTAGELLGREFGPAAQAVLTTAVDECCAELTRRMEPPVDTASDVTTDTTEPPVDTASGDEAPTDTEEVTGDDDDGDG
jgi:hypothetical protein